MARKYESTKVRQRQIVDAARKVIVKFGSENVTVKRIAGEVGISETAVYRHFKSKKDILLLLTDYIERGLEEEIAEAASGGLTPMEALDAMLQSHLSVMEQRLGISFQVIAEIISLGDEHLNARVSRAVNRYTEYLKGILEAGVRSGEVRDDIDLEAAAAVLFGIVQGLVNTWALEGYRFDARKKYAAHWNIFREAVIKR